MSWDCPNQSGPDNFCERLKKTCKPMQKGCILAGRFKLSDRSKSTGRSGDSATKAEPPDPKIVKPEQS